MKTYNDSLNHGLCLFQIEKMEEELRKGNIHDAIVFYQEIKGNTFEESKQIIDNWILPENEAFSEQDIQERASLYLIEQGTIYAIKFVRDLKKIGLKEAIEYVYDLNIEKKNES